MTEDAEGFVKELNREVADEDMSEKTLLGLR